MKVKAQDQQASSCKFINVASPDNLTKPGFPDIAHADDKTLLKKRAALGTDNSILSGLTGSNMSKWSLIEVSYSRGKDTWR